MHANLATNTIDIQTHPGETLYYAHKYLQTVRMKNPALPPFWSQCPVGRIFNGFYTLWHTPEGKPESLTLTGPWPTGTFQVLTLEPGQSAFVSLQHVAGFVIREDHLATRPIIMQPLYCGLISPTTWIMGRPVPCIFHGPVSIIFYGKALIWDDKPGIKSLKPSQVVSFDATQPFSIRAMDASSNPMSVLFNALTLESRFIHESGPVLKENYIPQSSGPWGLLRHFIVHMLFFALWLAVLWLGR